MNYIEMVEPGPDKTSPGFISLHQWNMFSIHRMASESLTFPKYR